MYKICSIFLMYVLYNISAKFTGGCCRVKEKYAIQNSLSDAATRNEIIDSRAFSVFCNVESSNQIPDGDTIGRFRNLMIENGIQEKDSLDFVRPDIKGGESNKQN